MTAGTPHGMMQTFNGKPFWPLDPRPEDLDIENIAHGLSQTCRYNGQTRFHYSVAQHSVLVAAYVEPKNRLWAVLHDAPEACGINDIIRPVKARLHGYDPIETAIMRAVCIRFNLPLDMPEDVRRIDDAICTNEKAALFGPPAFEPENMLPALRCCQIKQITMQQAKRDFLELFYELTR
jgi:hypothetical protein